MSFWDSAKSFFLGEPAAEHRQDPEVPNKGGVSSDWVPSALAGVAAEGFNSVPTFDWWRRDLVSSAHHVGLNMVMPPPSAITYWRDYGFDTQTLSRTTPNRLIEIITDLSPDVSKAVWDIERFCNPGWEIYVTRPNSTSMYKKAETELNKFLDQIAKYQGDLEIFFGRLFMAAFVRGAVMTELVMDGMDPVEIAVPDPAIARFKKEKEGARGSVWHLGQVDAQGQWHPLWDKETVTYLPIDPFPGNPYGRSPINPAVFSVIFLISMMNDIRRVVAQQGYPRIDIEVDLAALAASMPPEMAADPQVFNRWVAAAIADVKKVYKSLQPDAAFVHTSVVKINSNVGVLDVNSLGTVNQIIDRLEKMAMKSLKSMPLLMGATEGMSEANANRQWEVFVAGIKIIQHRAENSFNKDCELALRAMGIQADVTIRFAELRTAELLRDAMTEQLVISNALSKYLTGAIDFKTYVFEITGKAPPTGVTEPLWIPKTFVPFGAPNATTAEATSEGGASPGQEGGGTSPTKEDTEDDRIQTEIARKQNGQARPASELVVLELEGNMRKLVRTGAGVPTPLDEGVTAMK